MATLSELSQLCNLTDQLAEKASRQDLVETAKLLAISLSHYQIKFGDLPFDEPLAMIDIARPHAEQTEMLV